MVKSVDQQIKEFEKAKTELTKSQEMVIKLKNARYDLLGNTIQYLFVSLIQSMVWAILFKWVWNYVIVYVWSLPVLSFWKSFALLFIIGLIKGMFWGTKI